MSDYRRAFDDLAAATEYPFCDPAALPTLLAYRAARELGEVALDGTGADTLLGIMPARHQRLAIAYGTLIPRPLAPAAGRRHGPGGTPQALHPPGGLR